MALRGHLSRKATHEAGWNSIPTIETNRNPLKQPFHTRKPIRQLHRAKSGSPKMYPSGLPLKTNPSRLPIIGNGIQKPVGLKPSRLVSPSPKLASRLLKLPNIFFFKFCANTKAFPPGGSRTQTRPGFFSRPGTAARLHASPFAARAVWSRTPRCRLRAALPGAWWKAPGREMGPWG